MEAKETEAREALSEVDESPQHHEKSHEVPGSAPLASSLSPLPPETQTVDGVLELAVQDVGVLIPTERSVLFIYDKAANQLKPQFVYHHSKSQATTDEDGASPIDHENESSGKTVGHLSMTGFPPVVGMISACFLHKRCLRMQEPHPHRAFHRDYDAPKDMSVDSILCAPIILHHRVIGVLQLINRIDLDVAVFNDDHVSPNAPASRTGHHHHHQSTHYEDEREIKLRRLNTVKAHARIGFSPKDEQKLIQFANHVAQVVESKLKLAGGDGETQATLRDEHTRSALELLGMLNEKIDYQGNSSGAIVPRSGPMPIRKKAVVIELDVPLLGFGIPEQASTPPPWSPKSFLVVPEVDPLLVAMAIVRIQARFRGRRVRRAEEFANALEKFRHQKQRIRSAILIQRLARGSIVRHEVRSQKLAVRLLARAYNKFKFRAKIEDHMERKRSERPPNTRTVPSKPNKPQFPKCPNVVVQDIDKFQGGLKSLAALQKRFRDSQASKAAANEASVGLTKLIKLQSFLRGSLVRKHVKQLISRAAPSPTVVCLRIASGPSYSSNQLGHSEHRCGDHGHPQDHQDEYNCCVYAMPERVAQAAYVSHKRSRATRHRLEEMYDQVRNPVAAATVRRTRAWDTTPSGSQTQPAPSVPDDYAFGVELRRLTPSNPASSERKSPTRGSPRADVDPTVIPTHRLSQAFFPGFAFDPMRGRKGKQSPPGVEYVSEVRPRRGLEPVPGSPATSKSAQRHSTQQHALASSANNVFRRQAFYAVVGISRPEARDPGPGLPELGLQGSPQQQLKRSQTLGSPRVLCCLLPAATGNKSRYRLQRDSRLSVSLGLSQQNPSPKRPSTTTAPLGTFSDEPSPRKFGSHRKLTVPSASVVP